MPNLRTDLGPRQQQHVTDLVMEIAMKAYEWHKNNPNVPREDIAKWVRNTLRESMNWDITEPVGMSWGVFKGYIQEEPSRGFTIVSANRPD